MAILRLIRICIWINKPLWKYQLDLQIYSNIDAILCLLKQKKLSLHLKSDYTEQLLKHNSCYTKFNSIDSID